MKWCLLALMLLLGLVIRPDSNELPRSDSNATGIQMLQAFVGDRDYPRALQLARRVPAGSEFRHEADVLKRELPKRMNDFKTLKLPTPSEWADLQNHLSREEKIRYLCDRLRLMNYFNQQKWGSTVQEMQFAEPRHLNCDSSISQGLRGRGCELGLGKTETINPFMILDFAMFGRGPLSQPLSFDLTLDDIPLLTEYMEKDWAILGLDYWRLDRTSDLLALIVYKLSDDFFRDLTVISNLNETQKKQSIKRVQDWARASHGLEKAERVARRVKEVNDWSEISWLDDDIEASKRPDLIPYLFKMVDRLKIQREQPNEFNFRSSSAEWVLSVCESLDARMTAEKTREFLHDRYPGLRLMAGHHEFLYGEKRQGAVAICSSLQDANWSNFYITGANASLNILLRAKAPCATGTIQTVLGKDYFLLATREDQATFLDMLRKTGSAEGYRWLLKSLSDTTPTSSWSGDGTPILIRDVAAELTTKYMAPESAALSYELKASTEQKAKDRQKQARWLEIQIKRLEASQKS